MNVGHPQEIYYYCGKANKVEHEDVTSDSISLKGKFNPDAPTLQALTDEQGPLAAGALPSAAAGNEQALWQAVTEERVAKSKAKAKAKASAQQAQQMEPMTPKQAF